MNRIKKLSNRQKILCIVALVFFISSIGIITLNFSFSSNGNNYFHSYKIEDKEVDNVVIKDITVNEENGITKYEATIEATDNKTMNYIKIIIKDQDNKEIVSLIGYVGSSLSKGETRKIESSTDADISNIHSIEYEIV